MTKTLYFYDTNILLNNDLDKLEKPLLISSVTLQELEHIKTSGNKSEEVKYKARRATRWLLEHPEDYRCIHRDNETDKLIEELKLDVNCPDNQIISGAKYYELYVLPTLGENHNMVFVTNDIACYNIALNIFSLKVLTMHQESDDYRGYKYVELTGEEYTRIYGLYEEGNNFYNLIENQYLIIKDIETNKEIVYAYRDNKLVTPKLPRGIKALNSKQLCALDLLNNKDIPIKVIAGTYGSGKTYLGIRTGLYHVKEKGTYSSILLVRNPRGAGEEVGFLPGDLEDKTADFFAPFIDNMEGGEQELENMKRRGEIDTQIPFYLKGRSIPSTYIIVDEAEDLTAKDFKLIGSRIAKNSCVVFTGDFKQAETKYIHNNGLSKFIQHVKDHPSSLVGVIVLDDDVRSDASKYFVDFE